jgi:metal iron transporter
MNYPSRNDDTKAHPDWNQSPQALNSDATTRADLNGMVNLRQLRQEGSSPDVDLEDPIDIGQRSNDNAPPPNPLDGKAGSTVDVQGTAFIDGLRTSTSSAVRAPLKPANFFYRARDILYKYVQFVGPGFLIAVAYIDPGNYATDVEAGASTQYKHLFIVLMSNLFAIFLQSLCIKLGSVTGLNLAENCRKHLPKWLNITLYLFAESAIIATDIAEVCSIDERHLGRKADE